jgi:hypothetical protein
VAFIGTKEDWKVIQHTILANQKSFLAVSSEDLLSWYKVLTSSNEFFQLNGIKMPDISAVDLQNFVTQMRNDILNSTTIFDNPTTEELDNFVVSDVGKVRNEGDEQQENFETEILNDVFLHQKEARESEKILKSCLDDLSSLTHKGFITREKELQNEFSSSEDIMLGTFPYLFLLGKNINKNSLSDIIRE